MWVYQETPETAAAKALPEAIMPTAQEEQLKQKNGGVHPETSQDERQSIPAAFSERCRNTPERTAVRRGKLSRKTILLAAAYLLGTFLGMPVVERLGEIGYILLRKLGRFQRLGFRYGGNLT